LGKQQRLPKLKLPVIKTLADLREAYAKTVVAANRKYPVADGERVTSMLGGMTKIIEICDLEPRIQELEQRLKGS
jgi:hypothetical protein